MSPAALQRHDLADEDGEAVGVEVEGLHHRLHARHVALVIGSPDVDDSVETAPPELVTVVGDIGREVRWRARAAHDDVVLLIAQRSGSEPLRAVAHRGVATLAEEGHRLFVLPVGIEVALAEPDVEVDADAFEVGAYHVQHAIEGFLA